MIFDVVMRGHSSSKTGVKALVTRASIILRRRMDCRVKPGNDVERVSNTTEAGVQ
jgi:hypothetical protein